MNSHLQSRIEQLSQWFDRLLCRMRVARQLGRARHEISRLSAYELRDMGISHAALAESAARACCA
jgi:uncharacterized protein YjiS (DUF1127 family)